MTGIHPVTLLLVAWVASCSVSRSGVEKWVAGHQLPLQTLREESERVQARMADLKARTDSAAVDGEREGVKNLPPQIEGIKQRVAAAGAAADKIVRESAELHAAVAALSQRKVKTADLEALDARIRDALKRMPEDSAAAEALFNQAENAIYGVQQKINYLLKGMQENGHDGPGKHRR